MKKVRFTIKKYPQKMRWTWLYADLHDAETGELMISAEINYVIKAIVQRGYTVVP